MSDQRIKSFIDPKALKDLDALVDKLEAVQVSFKPLMEEIKSTSQILGASSNDVKSMVEAFAAYNKVMDEGGEAVKRYNSLKSQIAQQQKKLNEADEQQLDVLTRLKEQNAALVAESKKRVHQHAAEEGAEKQATRTKIEARLETQRLTAQMKRQSDVARGSTAANRQMTAEVRKLIDTSKSENLTHRAKTALLAELREKYKDAGGSLQKELIPHIQRLDREVKKSDAAIGVHTRNVGNYATAMRGVAALVPGMSRFFTGFGILGAGVMAAVGAIKLFTSAVKYGFNTIKEFEQANADLASILMTTTRETRALQRQAVELGRTTGYTAKQISGAHLELARLGFAQQTILEMTKPLLGFTTIMHTDLPNAAKVAGQAIRAFNMSAKDTEEVLTMMTTAANKSAMDFNFLQQSIAIVGASASMVKMPLRDTLALLGTLANSGLDASRAATALRNVFLYVADDSKKLGREFKGVEMSAAEFAKRFKELRLEGVEMNEVLQLTDKRAANATAVLIQNAEQIQTLNDEITGLIGTLDALKSTRLDTIQGDITLLKSAWDAFWLSFRDNVPFIRKGLQEITLYLNLMSAKRNVRLSGKEGSSMFGTDIIDTDKIRKEVGKATDELNAAQKAYNIALQGTLEEADAVYQKLLNVQRKWRKESERIFKSAGGDFGEYVENFKDSLTSAINATSSERGKNTLRTLKGNLHFLVANRKSLSELGGQIIEQGRVVSKAEGSEERYEAEQELRRLQNEKVRVEKLVDTLMRLIEESFDKISGNRSIDNAIERSIDNFRKDFKVQYAAMLTSEQTASGILGSVRESERTGVEQSQVAEFNLLRDKRTKEQIEADRVAKKLRDMNRAEELADFTREIEGLKTRAQLEKEVMDDSRVSWDLRREAAENYEVLMVRIAELEMGRKMTALEQDVIKANVGFKGKVVDENVIDPITNLPQTDVQKALLSQRLAIVEEFARKETAALVERNKNITSLNDKEEREIERQTKSITETFNEGLEQRLKDVETARLKEQTELARRLKANQLNETTYRDELLQTNLAYDNKALGMVQIYYAQWIKKLNLPDELKGLVDEEVKKALEGFEQKLGDDVSKSETALAVQTSKLFKGGGRRTSGSRLRSWFSRGQQRNEDDTLKDTPDNKLAKSAGKVEEFMSSEEFKQATSVITSLTDVVTGYYDLEIAKIDEVINKSRERYEKESQALDERLDHLQRNLNAGLISEENYNAQVRQAELEKEMLAKRQRAEEAKLDKQRREIQTKQAKWQKANAITQAVISTAQGVIQAMLLPNPILAAIFAATVGAVGAAQIAIISAQKIPQYAEGTDSHVGGKMIVGDGYVSEVVMTPDGKIMKTPNVPTLMEAPAYTKVFKSEEMFLNYLYGLNADVDKAGGVTNIQVHTNSEIEQRLLRSIDGKLGRLNANERYRIMLERHKEYSNKW